jgi:hypothetical protein
VEEKGFTTEGGTRPAEDAEKRKAERKEKEISWH